MEIVKQEVMVQTGNERMPCHVARPASGGPYPGLVVVMEAFGLNENIKQIANRFAAEGFATIAPNLYFRMPNNVVGYDDLPGAIKLMGGLKDDQIVADMTAAINHLKARKDVKPKFGTTGFCMGGRVAFPGRRTQSRRLRHCPVLRRRDDARRTAQREGADRIRGESQRSGARVFRGQGRVYSRN